MRYAVITSGGDDRTGIVADLTGIAFRLGCNLADATASTLGDQFVIVLLAEIPNDATMSRLKRELQVLADDLGLEVHVRPLDSVPARRTTSDVWRLTLRGPDRRGLVHLLATVLRDFEININDLFSHIDSESPPGYSLTFCLDMPSSADEHQLRAALDRLARDLGVVIDLYPV